MKDRFKFRAWDKDSNTMIFTDFSDGSWSDAFWFDIRAYSGQFVLMQSTGLRDKNGTLVFEKDKCIITFREWFSNGHVSIEGGGYHSGIVRMIDYEWVVVDPTDKTEVSLKELTYEEADVEVIGNIYENPELLT